MRTSKMLLAASLVVVLALVVSGCKTAAEKSVEKTIEKATNSHASVDLTTNTVTINTNTGSYQAGGAVKIPDNFPTDVYVIPGTVQAASTTNTNQSFIVSIAVTQSVADAKAVYDSKLKASGWTFTMDTTVEGTAAVIATKGDRTVSVGISDTNGQTLVVIQVYRVENTNTNS